MFAFTTPTPTGASRARTARTAKCAGPRMQSNNLARQGLGPPLPAEAERKDQRQRAAGIPKPGIPAEEPGYMTRVPSRAVAGDLREEYMCGGLGNATSSRGFLDDVLQKVPRQAHGTSEYKRINMPAPQRLPGFDNQGATP